ncbi:MAG TPA: hypothetical protein VN729_06405 [Ktedonobacteraceae bacterium]|nr:hypothetical protein [Ktedonobacteraceae bacterium]
MQCLALPFFQEIENAQSILLAGAGGGFDIFSGLPLYFGLRNLGKQVHLANLSFSPLSTATGCRLSPALMEVTADTQGKSLYFPEKYLAQWFVAQGEHVPIYCFERTGVQPLLTAYQTLVDFLHVDTIILIDGGTDSLMRGDEPGLGTPEEDIASMSFHPSIVSTSILSALAGLFGDVQMNERTTGSQLFINVLMTLYWCFRVDPLAQRLLYLDKILYTQTSREVRHAIEQFRATLPTKKAWIDLPM